LANQSPEFDKITYMADYNNRMKAAASVEHRVPKLYASSRAGAEQMPLKELYG
jgi:hypothetical protein